MARFGFAGTSGLIIAGMTWALVVVTGGCQQILGIPDELPPGPAAGPTGGMGGAGAASSASSTSDVSTSGMGGMANGGMGGAGQTSSSTSSGMGTSSSSSGSCYDCFEPIWSRGLRGNNNQVVNDVAVDNAGNIIFVGSITGNAELGADCPGGPCPLTAIAAGTKDIFIVKLDSTGAPIWSKVVGDSADLQEATSVTTDSADNIIVVGQFMGMIDFGGNPLQAAGTGTSTLDIFVAKLAPNGDVLWSKSFSNLDNQWVTGVATDSNQHIVIGGQFVTSINAGCGNLTSTGTKRDIFIGKLDTFSGDCIWSKDFGDDYNQWIHDLAVNKQSDEVFIVGECLGTVLGRDCGVNASDILVAGFDSMGTNTWAHNFGDELIAKRGLAIAAPPNSGIYVTGQFLGALDFGGGMMATNSELDDGFVLKLDATGIPIWANFIQAPGEQIGYGISWTTDAMGTPKRIFVTGKMDNSFPFAGTTLDAGTTSDTFVLGYDLMGTPQCGVSYDNFMPPTSSLAVAPGGDLILGANFQNTTDLGCMQTTMSLGGTDALIARIKP